VVVLEEGEKQGKREGNGGANWEEGARVSGERRVDLIAGRGRSP
jgi:hypothetical protein